MLCTGKLRIGIQLCDGRLHLIFELNIVSAVFGVDTNDN